MGSRVSVPRSVLTEAAQCLARQGGSWADTMAAKLFKWAEPTRKRPKPSRLALRKAKARKKATKRDETAEIYRAVEKRADGRCERCGKCFPFCGVAQLDHARGRGREPQTERNTWLVGSFCHSGRTNPENARLWLEDYREHSFSHGHVEEAEWAEGRLGGIVTMREAEKERRAAELVTTGRYPQEPLKLSGRASGD